MPDLFVLNFYHCYLLLLYYLKSLISFLLYFFESIFVYKIYYKYKELSVIDNLLNGLKPVIVGLIASATIGIVLVALFNTRSFDLSQFDFNLIKIILFSIYLFIMRKYKPSPISIIFLSGILGLIIL